jgi:hypothetical protein
MPRPHGIAIAHPGHDKEMVHHPWRAVCALASAVAVPALMIPALMIPGLMSPALARLTPAAEAPVPPVSPISTPRAAPFRGTPAVGALFTDRRGRLRHFCTASVVHSPRGNLLVTAAHCLRGKDLEPAGTLTFAPGYHDGRFPYGRWLVRAVYVDRRWRKDSDPDDDVASCSRGGPAAASKNTPAPKLWTLTPDFHGKSASSAIPIPRTGPSPAPPRPG